jgi:hypothetical protein
LGKVTPSRTLSTSPARPPKSAEPLLHSSLYGRRRRAAFHHALETVPRAPRSCATALTLCVLGLCRARATCLFRILSCSPGPAGCALPQLPSE